MCVKVSEENRETRHRSTEDSMAGNRIRDLQNRNAEGCLDVFTCSTRADKYPAVGENP